MSSTRERTLDPSRVIVRETDLYEVWCHALESGEWEQIRDQMYGENPNDACVYGVGTRLFDRAGLTPVTGFTMWHDWRPRFERAAVMLGYASLDVANDAGVPFPVIASALRQARSEVG